MDVRSSPTLTALDDCPPALLDATAAELHRVLDGPTLVHLPGRRSAPLFVSALLHGNEDVGLRALQALLTRYRGKTLPRALSFFIGNVDAARTGVRRLDGQPDYNRVWPGTDDAASPEARVMQAVTDALRERHVFASIDLHNNTGLNPHYACVSRLDTPSLQLASLFSRTVVHFSTPVGVQSAALAALCPAITCECGKVGDEAGVARAAELIEAALHLEAIPGHPLREGDVHLFHTVATVRVDAGAAMSFDGKDADVRFVPDLDHFNFRELSAGAVLATVSRAGMLRASGEHGEDVTRKVLDQRDGQARLAAPLMPSMLTRDERVVRQDCLCYLMERMPGPSSF